MHTGPLRAPRDKKPGRNERNVQEKGQTQMENLRVSLCCPLLLIAVDFSWSYVLNPSFPIYEGQMQENIACIRGLKHKYALYTETYSHLSETSPAEQVAAPGSGESKSLFNLLQTKDSNMHMLLRAPGCPAGFLMRGSEAVHRERPG